MLGDVLDVLRLAVAYYRPKNLRDLLTPSALKMCQGKDNNAEFHLEGTPLVNCIEEKNYRETRENEIKEEGNYVKRKAARINSILKNSGQSTIPKNIQGTN